MDEAILVIAWLLYIIAVFGFGWSLKRLLDSLILTKINSSISIFLMIELLLPWSVTIDHIQAFLPVFFATLYNKLTLSDTMLDYKPLLISLLISSVATIFYTLCTVLLKKNNQ